MKLIYEVTFRDDKKRFYDCVDFYGSNGDFIIFYLKHFKREYVRSETVLEMTQTFKA